MQINRLTKKNFSQYLKLRKEDIVEYSKIIGEKIKFNSEQLKKDFESMLKSKTNIIFVAMEKDKLLGYLNGSILKNIWQESGYIDDIFITKDFKQKRIGTQLIKKFIEFLKRKNIKKCKLGVNIKNTSAINLYKKLGFKIYHYEMSLNI